MKLTRESPITGKLYTIDIPITEEQYEEGVEKYKRGALVQVAFPMLNAGHREFVLSGIPPEEWDEYIKTEDD